MTADHAPHPTLLARYIAGRDLPCPGCARPLANVRDDRCTHCNEHIIVRVDLAAPPRLAPFIAGVIGLSLGVGFGGAILAPLIPDLLDRGRSNLFNANGLAALLPPLLMLPLNTSALVLWTRRRNRLRCLRTRTQLLLVAACWALTAAGIATFLLSLFLI